jgi:hypothetical protein
MKFTNILTTADKPIKSLFLVVFKTPSEGIKMSTAQSKEEALGKVVDIAIGRTGDGNLEFVRVFSVTSNASVTHWEMQMKNGRMDLLEMPNEGVKDILNG